MIKKKNKIRILLRHAKLVLSSARLTHSSCLLIHGLTAALLMWQPCTAKPGSQQTEIKRWPGQSKNKAETERAVWMKFHDPNMWGFAVISREDGVIHYFSWCQEAQIIGVMRKAISFSSVLFSTSYFLAHKLLYFKNNATVVMGWRAHASISHCARWDSFSHYFC